MNECVRILVDLLYCAVIVYISMPFVQIEYVCSADLSLVVHHTTAVNNHHGEIKLTY